MSMTNRIHGVSRVPTTMLWLGRSASACGCSVVFWLLCSFAHSQAQPQDLWHNLFADETGVFAPRTDSTNLRVGVTASVVGSQHLAGFSQLPNVPTCCPQNYGRMLTAGLSGELMLEAPISHVLGYSLRLGYTQWSGIRTLGRDDAFRVLETQPINSLPVTGASGVLQATLEHVLYTELSTAHLMGAGVWRPLRHFSMLGGVQLGSWLSPRFRSFERIVAPSNIAYLPDNSRTRGDTSGALPNVNPLDVALVAALSYEIPANRRGTTLLALELAYTHHLTSPLRGERWNINAVKAGLSLRFSPYRTTELSAQELKELYEDSLRSAQTLAQSAVAERRRADSLVRETQKQVLSAKIGSITGAFADGRRVENPTLRVERVNTSESKHLLNYVFFPEGSAVLPSRYKRILPSQRGEFSIDSVAKLEKLNFYSHVLNVIGKRLAENPQVRITLVGCTADLGTEQGNRKLARLRAEAVAAYLDEVWRISKDRINIQERGLPELHNDANTPQAHDEHRRVEILTSQPALLNEVRYGGVRRVVTPPVVEIGLDITAGAGLKQWSLEISQPDNQEVVTLASAGGTNTAPTLYRWDVTQTIPASQESVSLQLAVDDQRNNKIEAPVVGIPVEQVPATFDLFLAGVDARTLGKDPRVQQTLDLVRSQALSRPKTQITITGFNDASGNAERDRALSNERAQAVAKLLNLPNTSNVSVVAGGASKMFDNALPEGRLYNRFVQIEVQIPKQ